MEKTAHIFIKRTGVVLAITVAALLFSNADTVSRVVAQVIPVFSTAECRDDVSKSIAERIQTCSIPASELLSKLRR